MRILVAIGSRHGSTFEIGARLADDLRIAGFDVDVQNAAQVTSLDGFQAVLIGSAVYMGQWTADARSFIEEYRGELASVPVWIFSSGPVGDEAGMSKDIPGHEAASRALDPEGERVFAGELYHGELNVAERLMARLAHAKDGDYRDWEAITAWAEEIAQTLADRDPTGKPVSS